MMLCSRHFPLILLGFSLYFFPFSVPYCRFLFRVQTTMLGTGVAAADLGTRRTGQDKTGFSFFFFCSLSFRPQYVMMDGLSVAIVHGIDRESSLCYFTMTQLIL
ncbi:hypothetical protein F5X99DRAFT_390078 [Biscogniauxia marginata]|nr:hypothetical protein F5X99DRAFT_390078 [Biscogniauxia marginata]